MMGSEDRSVNSKPTLWWRKALGALKWLNHPWVRKGTTILLSTVALLSLAAILVANWETLRAFEWQIRALPLVLTFPAYSLALALAIVAWGLIMKALGASISWSEHVRVYCVTNLAKRLPGVLWYVAGRAILYDPGQTTKTAISVGSALELILTGLSGLVVGILAWPAMANEILDPLWLIMGLGLGLVTIHPRTLKFLLGLLGIGKEQTEQLRYGPMLTWLVLYCAVWICGGLVLFGLIGALYPLPLTQLPQVIGAWSLAGMVAVAAAILPAGLGLRELALGLLLANLMPEGIAIVIAILTRFLLTLYELVWVLLAYSMGKIQSIIL